MNQAGPHDSTAWARYYLLLSFLSEAVAVLHLNVNISVPVLNTESPGARKRLYMKIKKHRRNSTNQMLLQHLNVYCALNGFNAVRCKPFPYLICYYQAASFSAFGSSEPSGHSSFTINTSRWPPGGSCLGEWKDLASRLPTSASGNSMGHCPQGPLCLLWRTRRTGTKNPKEQFRKMVQKHRRKVWARWERKSWVSVWCFGSKAK